MRNCHLPSQYIPDCEVQLQLQLHWSSSPTANSKLQSLLLLWKKLYQFFSKQFNSDKIPYHSSVEWPENGTACSYLTYYVKSVNSTEMPALVWSEVAVVTHTCRGHPYLPCSPIPAVLIHTCRGHPYLPCSFKSAVVTHTCRVHPNLPYSPVLAVLIHTSRGHPYQQLTNDW